MYKNNVVRPSSLNLAIYGSCFLLLCDLLAHSAVLDEKMKIYESNRGTCEWTW